MTNPRKPSMEATRVCGCTPVVAGGRWAAVEVVVGAVVLIGAF
jgi:hypothetical protein